MNSNYGAGIMILQSYCRRSIASHDRRRIAGYSALMSCPLAEIVPQDSVT